MCCLGTELLDSLRCPPLVSAITLCRCLFCHTLQCHFSVLITALAFLSRACVVHPNNTARWHPSVCSGRPTTGGVAAWELLGSTIYGLTRGGSRLGPIEYVPNLNAADEELPITLQIHPELLEDPGTVQEFTWHMTTDYAPKLLSSTAAVAAANCSYDVLPGKSYLFGLVHGAPVSFKTALLTVFSPPRLNPPQCSVVY